MVAQTTCCHLPLSLRACNCSITIFYCDLLQDTNIQAILEDLSADFGSELVQSGCAKVDPIVIKVNKNIAPFSVDKTTEEVKAVTVLISAKVIDILDIKGTGPCNKFF